MNQRTRKAAPTARLIDLTPALAEELLSKNPRNRKISKANYAVVKRAIENGEWAVNGEAIKVSENGYILDGQHRCAAVVETGVTIRTFIIEGLPDETQDTMDTGKSRSLGDILSIHGEANATSLAALIRKFLIADKYGFKATTANTGTGYPVTNKEALAWLDANGWVRDYIHPGRAINNATGISSATASLLMRTFDEIDAEDSQYFWGRLVDGVRLGEGNPILVLRRQLKTLRDGTKGERNQRYVMALVIKAWNAYREGREIGLLKFRVGGAKPENFPEPK